MPAMPILLAALGGVVGIAYIALAVNGARLAHEHSRSSEPAIVFEPVPDCNPEPAPRPRQTFADRTVTLDEFMELQTGMSYAAAVQVSSC